MAERSSAHEWFNTAVAVIALLVAATSAYFSWRAGEAKKEALGIFVRPVLDCRTEYHGGDEGGQIGLCWAATLANESENRLSIVDQRILDIQDGDTMLIGGFHNLEAARGTPLPLPIILDAGEAKEIFVRGGVIVPSMVAHVIAEMPEFRNHTLGSLPLASVQHTLATAKLDFLGNKVDPTVVDGKYMGFSISPPFKRVINVLTLTTGRGATFSARMTYPPEP